MSEQPPRLLSDVDALKALAHPLRQRMLTWLHRNESATSADLATIFDADRGATSYHLRQLERYGFVEEDRERSSGRRKYWRPVPQDIRLPRGAEDPAVAAAAAELGNQWMEQAERDLHSYLADRGVHGVFADAATHSFGSTVLTAEELTRFGEEYVTFLKSWHREPATAPRDARHVTVLFHAFPTPT
ncbi:MULTISPECIES: helix-turn-helix domain-containing protein [Actinoplanes]|uniref:ArsR/SmtB family transcription factor n=1 Tax=Actinoplanes TaxID=1865 RepID=UPI000AD7FE0E|nr:MULTISPECIES: helix-turn-helix domain-containing protein [Actinoplanes]GLY06472.1 transcriptional regulator [Actinoplanes sp. NBRC 101535]